MLPPPLPLPLPAIHVGGGSPLPADACRLAAHPIALPRFGGCPSHCHAPLRALEAEAALLVARLPEPEQCRLRTAALTLRRAQVAVGAAMPQPLMWRILASSLA